MKTGLDPQLNGMNIYELRRTDEFSSLLERWNRAEYNKFAARLEVLIIRGYDDLAKKALNEFLKITTPSPVTLSNAIHDVLPQRVADAIEAQRPDIINLYALDALSDSEIMTIRNIGFKQLEVIRLAISAAKNGQRLEYAINNNEPDLEPEWDIDWDYLLKERK